MKEACGLFGTYGCDGAAQKAYLGLFALQHRGEESAGIVVSDDRKIRSRKGMGLLTDVIDADDFTELPGHMAIGHVRYSTTGSPKPQNVQPLVIEYSQGLVAVAHNGTLTNAYRLRRQYEARGSIFQTSTDSEVIVHLMADPEYLGKPDHVARCLAQLEGAFSFLIMTKRRLIAARDRHGFRPLSLGDLDGAPVVASETCAFDLLGARYVRDIEPGEMITIDERGVVSERFCPPDQVKKAHCIFEHIYFARPDSRIFGENCQLVRTRLGEILAREHPVDADVVMPLPDSGNPAALGFAHESGIPFQFGVIRNHYVGRTFIQPRSRSFSVRVKLNVIADIVRGKRVVVVDDSIVRGTTSRTRLGMLREAGATEIHLRISSPPIRHPCFFGIDFPTRTELVAAARTVEEVREFIGVDSLGYISVEGLLSAVSGAPCDYCTACFTGDYPCPVADPVEKLALERH
ncbi:MAG: amidophosphoribosyltransferase [Candidatus Brocadiae bacterium]|nr:amidophosphoribosyltransferase [Candidatus Brocadiia bacterium]